MSFTQTNSNRMIKCVPADRASRSNWHRLYAANLKASLIGRRARAIAPMVYSDGPCCSLTARSFMTSPERPAADAGHSPVYLKLFAETAKIGWPELERFFARGMLLRVARDLDLVTVAAAIAEDDKEQVTQWLSSGLVERMQSETAADFAARDPNLWAVVVSPWVCVQERD